MPVAVLGGREEGGGREMMLSLGTFMMMRICIAFGFGCGQREDGAQPSSLSRSIGSVAVYTLPLSPLLARRKSIIEA